jgi:hypothetical protein
MPSGNEYELMNKAISCHFMQIYILIYCPESYDAMTAYVVVVLSRYMMLAIENRARRDEYKR